MPHGQVSVGREELCGCVVVVVVGGGGWWHRVLDLDVRGVDRHGVVPFGGQAHISDLLKCPVVLIGRQSQSMPMAFAKRRWNKIKSVIHVDGLCSDNAAVLRRRALMQESAALAVGGQSVGSGRLTVLYGIKVVRINQGATALVVDGRNSTRRIAVRVWLQVVVMTTACARRLSRGKVP